MRKPDEKKPNPTAYHAEIRELADAGEPKLRAALAYAVLRDSLCPRTAYDLKLLTRLAVRLTETPGSDPAYDQFDWLDAVANFPVALDPEALLSLPEAAFQEAMDRAARFKREAYALIPHTEQARNVADFVDANRAEDGNS